MRILILGQPRSGTTALFLAKQAAMPPDTLALFEPASPLPMEALPSNLLVKTLVGGLPGEEMQPQWHPTDFDEVDVLVRDPRDRLISLLLFLPHWSSPAYPPLWQGQPKGLDRYRASLAQKVAAPRRLPTWALFERLMGLRFGFSRGAALPTLQQLQDTFMAVHAALPDCETIGYEALTTPIVGQVVQPPPPQYARILRRGTPGEWRHWFTPEDVDYFRPVFQPYLTWYGYGEDWGVPDAQIIRQATSTDYIAKWLRVDRRKASHATDTP